MVNTLDLLVNKLETSVCTAVMMGSTVVKKVNKLGMQGCMMEKLGYILVMLVNMKETLVSKMVFLHCSLVMKDCSLDFVENSLEMLGCKMMTLVYMKGNKLGSLD